MKIAVITVCYSSTACIRSLTQRIQLSNHEIEAEVFLHSRRPDVMQACKEFALTAGVRYHEHGLNRGVSTSWNDGVLSATGRGAEAVIIANDDISFSPGDLEKIAHRAASHRDRYIISCAGTHLGLGRRIPSVGYSCFAINPIALEKLGCFDQNVFPAYCEDQDYAYRAHLAGLEEDNCADTELTHAGSASIQSDARLLMQNVVTQNRNILYYRRKWGGYPGAEVFRAPFNHPRFSIHIPPDRRECPYGHGYDRDDRHIVRI